MTTVAVNAGAGKKHRKHLRPKPTGISADRQTISNTGGHITPISNSDTSSAQSKPLGYSDAVNQIKLAKPSKPVSQHSKPVTPTATHDQQGQLNGHAHKRHKPDDAAPVKLPSKSSSMQPAIDGISQLFNTAIPHTQLCDKTFEWLIYPLTTEQFYAEYFERKPVVIHRYKSMHPVKCKLVTVKHSYVDDFAWYETQRDSGSSVAEHNRAVKYYTLNDTDGDQNDRSEHYFDNIFSKHDIVDILHHRNEVGGAVQYAADIDLTQYKAGIRHTLNPTGKVNARHVWNLYNEDKCSIRFLCPHKYSTTLHRLINLLDTHFGMGVGANSYLTPAGSQGFAPHFDDVDVFVLQTEGSKRWRLYAPQQQSDVLAQHSSGNYSQEEIGEPILDAVLHEGDFLYAPRGTIHQCVASDTEHSLHVTLSTCLKTSWAEYMASLMPLAVQHAFKHDIRFRHSLPRQYAMHTGSQHAGEDNKMQQQMQEHAVELIQSVLQQPLPVDDAADQMALTYMHYRVPPCVPQSAGTYQSLVDNGNVSSAEDLVTNSIIQPRTRIRLVQPNSARLVIDELAAKSDNLVQLHHIAANSVEHMSVPLTCLDFSSNLTSALELILLTNPLYVAVQSLPLPPEFDDDGQLIPIDEQEDNQLRVQLVAALFADGLVEMSNSKSVLDSAKQLVTGSAE